MPEAVQPIEKIKEDQAVSETALQNLIQLIVAHRLDSLEKLLDEEVDILKSRNQRVRYLNQLQRAILDPNNPKEIDFETNLELKRLRTVGREMYKKGESLEEEAKTLVQKIEELENKEGDHNQEISKLEKKAKSLREEASELKDTAIASGSMTNKLKYSKEEVEKLVGNIRTAVDDLNSLNQMQLQKTTKLNNERHETLLMGKMIAKTVNDILVRMARGIAR